MIKLREYTDELGRRLAEYLDDDGNHRVGPASVDDEVCDFCLTPKPRWVYPTGPVEITEHPVIDWSDDPWGACDRCHEFIEAGDVDALAKHVYDTQKEIAAGKDAIFMRPEKFVLANFKDLFTRFMDARTGPAYLDETYFSSFYEGTE